MGLRSHRPVPRLRVEDFTERELAELASIDELEAALVARASKRLKLAATEEKVDGVNRERGRAPRWVVAPDLEAVQARNAAEAEKARKADEAERAKVRRASRAKEAADRKAAAKAEVAAAQKELDELEPEEGS